MEFGDYAPLFGQSQLHRLVGVRVELLRVHHRSERS